MKRSPRVDLTCRKCGIVFQRPKWEVDRGHDKYCGHACSHAASAGHPSYHPDARITKDCAACGNGFVVGGRRHPSKKVRFCSLDCKRAGHYIASHSRCRDLTNEEAAYIAALLDGEGSVMLVKRIGGNRMVPAGLRISISNTFVPVLNWLVTTTGIGKVYPHKRVGTRKQCYDWRTHGESGEELLRRIRPYMIIKATQADLAISVQEKLRVPAMKFDRSWQEAARLRMKALNATGMEAA